MWLGFFNKKSMKVVFFEGAKTITIIPRKVITNTLLLSLALTNESDNVRELHSVVIISYSKGILKLNSNSFSSLVKLGQTYKIELLNDGNLVYLNRLIVVDENTDIQNYSRANQSNSLFK